MDDDRPTILVIDDDAAVCWAIEQALTSEGYGVVVAAQASAALQQLKRRRPDAVLTDIRMPGSDGLDLLSQIRVAYAHLPVVVMTAYGTMETAIEAVKRGAFDYLPKPIALDRLIQVLRRALGEHTVAMAARPETGSESPPAAIIGATPAMQEVYRRVAAAAATDLGVLICGPTGSGKELVARALHQHSARRDGPFIAVNCGALPDNLVESELFGHEAGAFTDAKGRKIGRIEAADHGVLFLDEIGELPLPSQVKLLRFLEDQRFNRVGSEEEIAVDVRVIASTNRDLTAATTQGVFREDLAYRLRVVTIELPSLAQRLDDIPALSRYFLGRMAARLGRGLTLTVDAETRLRSVPWPGNVRQLKHVLEEAAVMATGGVISADLLRLDDTAPVAIPGSGLRTAIAACFAQLANQAPGDVQRRVFEEVEEILVREALARCGGNQLRAAELLGINRITLKKRMDQLGVRKA
jgi:nitrogen regulation protein NR(I)